MSEINVYIDNFNEKQRKVCDRCPASGPNYVGMIPFPLCKPARLEKKLGRIPTYDEAAKDFVRMASIPENCPNGYIGLNSREIR